MTEEVFMPSLFKSLQESGDLGELILREGGILQYHRLKKHPEIATIYILYVLPSYRGKGLAESMMDEVKGLDGITTIQAVVESPEDGPSTVERWYERQGFRKIGMRVTKSGKRLNIWVWTRNSSPVELSEIRRQRLALGLTLVEVSQATGVDMANLSLFERGHLSLPPEEVEKLKSFFEEMASRKEGSVSQP